MTANFIADPPPERRMPDGPAPTLIMIAGLLAMLVALGSILLLPLYWAMPLGVLLYALLCVVELRHHIISPTSVTSLVMYLLIALGLWGGQIDAWLPYSGSLFLGALFVVCFALLLMGRPFTAFYSAGRGHWGKHWFVSGMWTLIYFTGAVLGVVLMPDLSFVYAPMLLLVAGAVCTLVVNLVWFGPTTGRLQGFHHEGFQFAQIDDDTETLRRFYDLVAKEFWSSVRRSPRRAVTSLQSLRDRLRDADRSYADQILRFMAWKEGEAAGTICCIVDDPIRGLPIEAESGQRLDALRAVGPVMEIGKFAIASGYRTRQPVFLGLLRCAVEVAIARGIPFIVNDSYVSQTGLYRKIGFSEISGQPFEDSNGAECVLLALNLSVAVVHEHTRADNSFMNQVIPLLNSYLSERCYHRLVLTNFWRPRTHRPYDLSSAGMRAIQVGGGL